jgi:hypothetical protein
MRAVRFLKLSRLLYILAVVPSLRRKSFFCQLPSFLSVSYTHASVKGSNTERSLYYVNRRQQGPCSSCI